MQLQPDSVSSKIIFPHMKMEILSASVKLAAGEADCPGIFVCNNLNRTGLLFPRLMQGGNQRNSLSVRLAFKIPSAEIVIHNIKTSFPVYSLDAGKREYAEDCIEKKSHTNCARFTKNKKLGNNSLQKDHAAV